METGYLAANLAALTGWIALIAAAVAPGARRWAWPYAGILLPAALAVGYVALLFAYWSDSTGGFGSLAGVRAVFDVPGLLLAGWLHYLVFDLVAGAWIARRGAADGLPPAAIVLCLVVTGLFSPIGLLVFLALRAVRGGPVLTP